MAKRFRNEGRNNPRYALWHYSVLTRDNGRCLSCGTDKAVYVHNIFPSKENTYNVDDGISLCTTCKREISETDFAWICRCLIMDQKFKNKENNNGKKKKS